MRIFFLLLVLANIGFFAYHHFLAADDEAARQIAALQISPEKIRPVSAATLSAVTTAAPQISACAEWGPFAGPDIARADAALVSLALPVNATQRRVSDVDGYWVHMPPQKTRADVDRKVGELKALGITEFFVVTEAGQWRNAISLGLFKSEAAAEAELERLRARGVRSALVTRREKFLRQAVFFVREPDAATIARLTELNRDFTAAEIRAGSCPAAEGQ
ncbi:MAG: SPOR domain-containing protein [Burkholderiales bacterium]